MTVGRADARHSRKHSARRENLGEAEIEHLGLSATRAENIGRFDVAVNDVLGMRGIERARHLDANVEQFIEGQRSGGDSMLQRDAVEKFHSDKGVTALIVNLVNGANVRMI